MHNTSYVCTKGVCDGSLIWVKKVIDAMGLRWLSDVVGKRTQISHAIDRIAIASPKMSECFEKHGPDQHIKSVRVEYLNAVLIEIEVSSV